MNQVNTKQKFFFFKKSQSRSCRASAQTIGSAFLERVHKVQNSKDEHDLLK